MLALFDAVCCRSNGSSSISLPLASEPSEEEVHIKEVKIFKDHYHELFILHISKKKSCFNNKYFTDHLVLLLLKPWYNAIWTFLFCPKCLDCICSFKYLTYGMFDITFGGLIWVTFISVEY